VTDSGTTPSAKHYWWGTHRLIEPETTVHRIRLGASTLGITRVARITGLDHLGIPVIMVTRPASRNLSVVQGKGLTDAAAMASGLAEAVESFCAERIAAPARLAKMDDARQEPTVLIPELMMRHKPRPDALIPWTECIDMLGGGTRWVPSELVYADFSSPAPEGQGYFVVTTNGLAAGNSSDEALLHAICELIERDAVALWMVTRRVGRAAPPLDKKSLAGSGCLHLLSILDGCPIQFDIWDITTDIGIPCFACVMDDADSSSDVSLGRIVGAGCHPSADVALCRAITEAAQARLTIIAGARDDIGFETYTMMSLNRILAKAIRLSPSRRTVTFEDRSIATNSIRDDLNGVLDLLDAHAINIVVQFELPCPVEHMSCVRVLAPQLEGLFEKPWYRPGRRARDLAAALQ
jgi:YcaO-like protein with predicted kinase domain